MKTQVQEERKKFENKGKTKEISMVKLVEKTKEDIVNGVQETL